MPPPVSSDTSPGADVAARLVELEARIEAAARRSGRTGSAVTLIAVTKTVAPERIARAVRAGVRHLGENRVQEGLSHQAALEDIAREHDLQWHMIGHLQRNKARFVARSFDRLDSLDSLRLARALSKRMAERERRLPVLLEVNVSSEPSKHGFEAREEALLAAAREIVALPGLQVRGLMTIGPLHASTHQVRDAFRHLAALRTALRSELPEHDWSQLSMGMSGDFELAIEEGATQVRIGSAIFGPR